MHGTYGAGCASPEPGPPVPVQCSRPEASDSPQSAEERAAERVSSVARAERAVSQECVGKGDRERLSQIFRRTITAFGLYTSRLPDRNAQRLR